MDMILQRNYVYASTLGHVIRFEKGKAVNVPAIMVQECAVIGAVPVDSKIESICSTEEEVLVQPVDPNTRLEAVAAVLETMVEKNERGDFTPSGTPKTSVVSELAGFKVDRIEVARAWKDRHDAE